MTASDRWAIPVGRWGETRVSVHASLLAMLAFLGHVAYMAHAWMGPADPWLARLVSLVIIVWLVAILLREMAHWLTARGYGLALPEIVFGPAGNLAPMPPTWQLRPELVTHLSGMVPHMVLMGGAAAGLLRLGYGFELITALLNPFGPPLLPTDPIWADLVFRVVFWVNWSLLLIHFLPVWPFDGCRSLQILLLLGFHDLSRRLAQVRVTAFAYGIAVALLVLAWFFRQPATPVLLPAWLVLLVLAGFVFFLARVGPPEYRTRGGHLQAAAPAASDHDRLQPAHLESAAPRLEKASGASGEELPAERDGWGSTVPDATADQQRLDDVLRRLHRVGLDRLTPDERAVLDRMSARLRARRKRGGQSGTSHV